MKQWWMFIMLVLVGLGVQAQRVLLPVYTVQDTLSTVGLYGYGSAASSGLTNRFLFNLTQSDFLSQDMRMEQYSRLNDEQNRLGGHYSVGLQGRLLPFSDKSWSLLFSFTDEAFGEASLSKEAFGVTFFGNKPYAGDTLNIGGNYLRFTRFQKFGFGAAKRTDEGVSYGLLLSFVNGEAGGNINMPGGWLYTSERGDTLSASAGVNAFVTDTGNTGFMRHNGAGAMVDLYLSQEFEFLQRRWEARATIMNMGVIQWRPNTTHYRIDSTAQWTGIRLDDINNLEAQVNAVALEDSIAALLNQDQWRGPENRILPGWMQFEVNQVGGTGFTGGLGVTFRPESFAYPYGYLLPGYRFGDRFAMELELGYGGYAGFQSGLAARFDTRQWAFRLRAANVEAAILPGSFGGLTLAGSVQYSFGL